MIHLFNKPEDLSSIKGKRQLTNSEVDQCVTSIMSETSSKQHRLFEGINNKISFNLFINLSQVQFSKLSAINYIVLQIDSICKKYNIINVYVALPTLGNTSKEIKSNNPNYTDELRRKDKDKRANANNFLKNVNFIEILRETVAYYRSQIFFTERLQFETDFKLETFTSAFESFVDVREPKSFGYKFLYPLKWIYTDDDKINYDLIEEKFDQTLENEERGLDSFDVKAIKNVIFHELKKNVIEHTSNEYKSKRFLLSIGLISTLDENPNELEVSFYEFIKKHEIPSLVEIYFGDTGGGFFTEDFIKKCKSEGIIQPSEQLRWAFKRWSTKKFEEERRGTKGLYRILRIVNNYKGIIQITTNEHNGGYFYNGEWKYRKTTKFSGSFLQMKLCPYSIIKEFKFDLSPDHLSKNWKTVLIDLNQSENIIKALIHQEFKSSEDKNLFIILDVDKIKYQNFQDIEFLLNNILLEVSYNANPSGAVIYINSIEGENTISNLINSANEYIKNKTSLDISEDSDNEEIYDPTITIYNGKVLWYGGSQNIISILDELYEENFNKKIFELKAFNSLENNEKIRVRQSLENDNNLVYVNNNGEIKLNFINLDQHFLRILEENVKKEVEEQNKRNINFCSPKVQLIKNWISVSNIIKDNEYGFALTLFLKLLEKIDYNLIKGDTFLLIDHEQHFDLALAFSRLLNIRESQIINIQEEIEYNSLKRFKLFREKSNVIILTSIIGTSETVRRLVKYVKRDNAFAKIILCLRNYRKYDISKIQTWGTETEIISIYQENITEEKKQEKTLKYYEEKNTGLQNFTGRLIQPNYMDEPIQDRILIKEELLELFKKTKSLHYNHIGVKNDRHFTFYINKPKLLSHNSFIWNKIEEEILQWKKENAIADYTIYIKNDLIVNPIKSEFFNFLKNLSKGNIELFTKIPTLESSKVIKSTPERSNIFLIDFGVISGKSINKILIGAEGLDNLYICVLFNQNNSGNFKHYKRIMTITDDNSDLGEKSMINTKINFLLSLPLNYYGRDNCPICNHNEALDIYKMSDDPEDYMFNFSEDRQHKLAIRSKDEIFFEEYPFDFYYVKNEKKDHELSSEIINKMFILKTFLEDSIYNTQSRIKIYNILFNTYINQKEDIRNPDSYLYAIVYFLSFEIHWLQREPLIFSDFRLMLSSISSLIATYDFEILKKYFVESKIYNANALGCVTRYKYSAISLLRSTNKLKFCTEISSIASNSFNGLKYSDNLLQNIFFHTYSILKNKYNKSSKYYDELIKSYADIKNISELSEGQKSTSTKLYFLLNSKLTEVNIEYLSDLELIKRMKDEIRESYTGFGHPQLETIVYDLSLEHISEKGLYDLQENQIASEYYSLLNIALQDSGLNWEQIQRYLYRKIIPIYKKLSNEIKNSITFKDEYQLVEAFEQISTNDSNNILHNFNQLINQLTNNPLYYLQIKPKYDEILAFISQRIIKKNSDLLSFLDQFPLNLRKVIEDKELTSQFPKLKLTFNSESLVFYPSSRFKKDIGSIISSIKSRLISKFQNSTHQNFNDLSEVDLIIEMSENEKYVLLKISYNNTSNESHHHHKNQKGGLTSIQDEMRNYGGDVLFVRENNADGFFNITFKFLKYE